MDGNGRMGRLWQTVILSKWDPLFLALPIETIIYERQRDYYAALATSDIGGNSTAFIEFILTAISDTIAIQDKHQDEHQVEFSHIMLSVLNALGNATMSRKEIFSAIGLIGDTRAFRRNIATLLQEGYIEMTEPSKPNSKLQKYRLTVKGKKMIPGQHT